jgi:competence protein ComEA
MSRNRAAGAAQICANWLRLRGRVAHAFGTFWPTAPIPGLRNRKPKETVMSHHSRILVRSLIASLLPMAAWAGPVNVNTADASTLARELDGIGPVKAQAIVEYRQKNGPFRAADDLLKVDGIGQRVLDQNRTNIRIEKGGQAPSAADRPAAARQPAARD